VPGMSALGRALGAEVDRRQPCRIARIARDGDGWQLLDEEGTDQGRFDAVVVATPSPQAVPLLSAGPTLAEAAGRAVMAPCWTGVFAFDAPLALNDVADPGDGPLVSVHRNGAKPGRDGGESWVVHARSDWSRKHLEAAPDSIVQPLFEAFASAVESDLPAPRYARAHRWRYAHVETPVGEPCLFDRATMLAACGDWCLGPGVEAAFLSGAAAAGRILNAAVSRDRASREVSPEEHTLTV